MGDALLDRLDPKHYPAVARMLLADPVVGWVNAGEDAASDNPGAFAKHRLLPRVLRDVSAVSTATTIAGTAVKTPIAIAPIGIQKALHPEGEIAMARGAAAAGAIYCMPVNATIGIDEVAKAVPDANLWIQLYNWPDKNALAGVIQLAEASGAKAIVPLVNTPLPVSHTPAKVGWRLPAGVSLAHGAGNHGDLDATNDFGYITWMKGITSLPIVPKGIMHPDDALRALDAGATGVIVSNHGNRQVARSTATIDALPAVVKAVGDRAEVYHDGGVRNGTDALIALGLGARAVFVARTVCWGLAVGGAAGVEKTLGWLTEEMASDAGMCGVSDITELPADLVQTLP
ncbi:MAG: alpha-hydroxy acid oxidase [Chloroflexota bacterium]